ncbi:unnamed protein product [Fraxinus pennsylvanica]|uniref:Pentatricopeptide repeat-containing protein n=1 Tax=Fraxinus pennsylvanica TaxID=56036 RepID=A0AAD2A3Z1_9LAMI|nr:unnamed protein product [Fraxinus pennsylvanica]
MFSSFFNSETPDSFKTTSLTSKTLASSEHLVVLKPYLPKRISGADLKKNYTDLKLLKAVKVKCIRRRRGIQCSVPEDSGLKNELVLWDPNAPRFVLWNGKLRPVPSKPTDLPFFDLMSIPGKIRTLAEEITGIGTVIGDRRWWHFDKMKALEIEPDRKVYNAVIHALAKGRLVKEARGLVKIMEEKGIDPDTITYNSLIKPLCKARLCDEAKEVFDEMIERRLSRSTRTYHAFFRILRTGEEVFQLLERMHMECHPSHDTYIMLIRKFCRWRQLDNVFKLWTEMSKNELDPDQSSYIMLIHGLFLNGKLEEAYKYYLEMKEKHLLTEPKID